MKLKIGKKMGEEEIYIGDLFHFDFKKLIDTPFSNSNLYKDMKEKEVEELYIYFDINDQYNMTEYELRYFKNGEMFEQFKTSDAMFLSYLCTKNDEMTLISNDQPMPDNNHESMSDLIAADKVSYGNLYYISFDNMKKSGYLKSETLDKYQNKGAKGFVFHFYDLKKEVRHANDKMSASCYAVSDHDFLHDLAEKDIEFYAERYKESGDDSDKTPFYFINYLGDLSPRSLNFIENKCGLLKNKIGNIQSTYKLEYNDVKPMLKNNNVKLKMR